MTQNNDFQLDPWSQFLVDEVKTQSMRHTSKKSQSHSVGPEKKWFWVPKKMVIPETKIPGYNLQGGVYSPLPENCTPYKGGSIAEKKVVVKITTLIFDGFPIS